MWLESRSLARPETHLTHLNLCRHTSPYNSTIEALRWRPLRPEYRNCGCCGGFSRARKQRGHSLCRASTTVDAWLMPAWFSPNRHRPRPVEVYRRGGNIPAQHNPNPTVGSHHPANGKAERVGFSRLQGTLTSDLGRTAVLRPHQLYISTPQRPVPHYQLSGTVCPYLQIWGAWHAGLTSIHLSHRAYFFALAATAGY